MSVLETAENKKTEKLLRKIRGFDILHVKQAFTADVAGSIREAQLTGGVQNEANKRGCEDLEESHRTAFTKVCDVFEKKNHLWSKNHETF